MIFLLITKSTFNKNEILTNLKVVLFSIISTILILILAINSILNIILPLKIKKYTINVFVEMILSYLVQFCIPYVIMVTLNIKVILRLRQSKRRAGLNNSVRQMNSTNSITNKGTRFTITTILIDIIFLVFHLPQTLLISYEIVIFYIINMNIYHGWVFYMCVDFSTFLSLSYSAVLVIMFIVFNRIFRKELVIFFRLEKLINFISPNFLNYSSNRL